MVERSCSDNTQDYTIANALYKVNIDNVLHVLHNNKHKNCLVTYQAKNYKWGWVYPWQ